MYVTYKHVHVDQMMYVSLYIHHRCIYTDNVYISKRRKGRRHTFTHRHTHTCATTTFQTFQCAFVVQISKTWQRALYTPSTSFRISDAVIVIINGTPFAVPSRPPEKKSKKKRRILLHNVCTHILTLSVVFSLLCVFFFLDFFFRVWCLGGVSERRVIFENSDDAINLKTRKLLAEGLRYFFL